MPGGRSLRGVRVLLTTATQDPDAARPFEECGAVVSWAPLSSIGPSPDPRSLQTAAARCGDFAWLAFTSRHGVEALARALSAPLPNPPKIAAIGPATANAVQTLLGRRVDVLPESYVAEALADAIASAAAPRDKILVVQAADARPVLVSRLCAAGLDVKSVPAYATLEQPPRAIDDELERADVVVLASGGAARSLAKALRGVGRLHAVRGKVIACIGPVTLAEARRAGFAIEVVAEQSTFESLAVALSSYFGETSPP